MFNKSTNNRKSLNNTIVNIVISILWVALICTIISSIIIWEKTSDLVYIISGVLGTLGILFNIYLLSKEKS
ncbi:hypothetical protein [uncultured Clostridium sp.]|uniref:hypothetical protein n=1 Tax=uncultured Clostridium sp. TaxID=59620 RepID=UPI0028E985E0|nr:hypothetical protein [uncultured Clostridium sp.]